MKKRVVYFDYLRVIATMSVVVLHVAAQHFLEFNGRSFTWNVFNFFGSIVRWGVPVFVMISGSLFLSRETTLKRLFSKNILRLVIAFFTWSTFYAIIVPLSKDLLTGSCTMTLKTVLMEIVGGAYHMWFIPMIIGLYLCIPILKPIVQKKALAQYFLVLSFVFAFAIPQLLNLSKDFIGGVCAEAINTLGRVRGHMHMDLVLGYSFYFVLGYLLNGLELTKKQRRIIYILGAVGFLTTIGFNAFSAWNSDRPCQTYSDNFNINVLLEAVAVHTWFKYRKYDNLKLNSFVSVLSQCSFGAYLVHVFAIYIFHATGLHTVTFSPLVSVPVISVIAIAISFFIAWILSKVPVIHKWMI